MADPLGPPTDRPYRPGVGIMLTDGFGRIFVAQRIDAPGAWQMPQGGIDKNEDPAAAAVRELREEIGTDKADLLAETGDWLSYDLPADIAGKVWRGRYRGQKQRWFAFRFTGKESDIDLTAHDQEFDAWRWAEADDVVGLIVPFKRPVYEAVVMEFAPILTAQRALRDEAGG